MDDRPRWWQFPWREIVCVTVGAFTLIWQVALEEQGQALFVGAGLALMGVGGTGAVQRAVKRVTNGKP